MDLLANLSEYCRSRSWR